jgi:hypothetical protein
MNLVSEQSQVDNQVMSTITAHLPHPQRTLGSRLEPVSHYSRRALRQLRRWNEGLDSDRHATICERTLRPYTESRFHV